MDRNLSIKFIIKTTNKFIIVSDNINQSPSNVVLDSQQSDYSFFFFFNWFTSLGYNRQCNCTYLFTTKGGRRSKKGKARVMKLFISVVSQFQNMDV